MINLELKIHPPVVALLFGISMWLVAQVLPTQTLPSLLKNSLVIIMFVLGMFFGVAGLVTFKLAHTTVNPQKPNESSSLVTSGIYQFSRNPMYVGLLMVLMGWGIYLSNMYSLIMTALFVLYINQYQIRPEEKALSNLFPTEFTAYTKKVRRWL